MNNPFQKQLGTVFITSLMILVILTIMGIATMNGSALAEKMTGNFRDEITAFQAAESGILDAENWLQTQANKPEGVASCQQAPCDLWLADTQHDLEKKSHQWWTSHARSFSGTMHNLASTPQYVIAEEMFVPYELSPEAMANGNGYQFYRITTRGSGNTNQSRVYLETVFSVKFN